MVARRTLRLAETAQPLGGHRPWLVCVGCGSRRRILYLCRAGARCRLCIGHVYERTPKSDRSLRDLQKVRRRLDGTFSLLDPFPPKPKGMWWRTYFALEAFYRKIEGECVREMTAWLTGR